MNEESPTPEEQAEADALARALEGKPARAPDDVQKAAALLRYARGEDMPDAALLARARERAMGGRVTVLRRRATLLTLAAAAAAVTLAVLAPGRQSQERAPEAREASRSVSPAAPGTLAQVLDAQADALADPERSLAALARASTQHRRELLLGLSARYGAAP